MLTFAALLLSASLQGSPPPPQGDLTLLGRYHGTPLSAGQQAKVNDALSLLASYDPQIAAFLVERITPDSQGNAAVCVGNIPASTGKLAASDANTMLINPDIGTFKLFIVLAHEADHVMWGALSACEHAGSHTKTLNRLIDSIFAGAATCSDTTEVRDKIADFSAQCAKDGGTPGLPGGGDVAVNGDDPC